MTGREVKNDDARFWPVSVAPMQEWMGSDLSKFDLLAVQIDGIHMTESR